MKAFRYTQEMEDRYTQQGLWGGPTFFELLDRNAEAYPHKEAVADSRIRMTFAQAKQWCDRVALGLLERFNAEESLKLIERERVTVAGGLYKDPEATLRMWGGEKDGWCATGDLGKVDEAGNLYIVGRLKDIIIRGGQNIAPSEVEALLVVHPKVLNVAIVAMPDQVMGEKACAFVITRPGQEFTFEEMVSFLREKGIATYKLPERLEIMEKFPMLSDAQKISKRELTASVTQKLKAEGKIP